MTLLLLALSFLLVGAAVAWLSTRVAIALAVAGSVFGVLAALRVLVEGREGELSLPWSVPYGRFHIGVDSLSAFFLVPLFVLSAVAVVYDAPHKKRLDVALFNVLTASMVLVLTARQAVLFLFAWELMSLASYFLVTLEHEKAEVRRAGWVYLISAHVGTALLIATFAWLGARAQSFEWTAMSAAIGPGAFLLALAGFGIKAGFVPFHVWLPEAHAAAPSHVSAIMSGVVIKMGIYGIFRVVTLMKTPPSFGGPLLIGIGLASAVLGISLGLYQRDLKRALAYSSIENMGLVTLGLGIGLWGFGSGRPILAALGMTGALFHVWNHTLMKGLLFLGAGSVVHRTGSQDMERLGGLMKRMPKTGAAMFLGALSISGLPPFNGFVSEWLLYLGLIEGGRDGSVAALFSVGLLSLVGGLTLFCFVRVVGVALLGQPRSEAAARAEESPASTTLPLAILCVPIVVLGVYPRIAVTAASRVLGGLPSVARDVDGLAVAHALLWGMFALLVLGARFMNRGKRPAESVTWDCGYAAPTARMQYTARSFAQTITEPILPSAVRARISIVPPSGLFPREGELSSECSDPVTRGVYEPFLARWADRFARLRWLQQGMLHVYVAYVLLGTLAALAWVSLQTWSGR